MSDSSELHAAIDLPLDADGLLPPPGLVRALVHGAATVRLSALPPHNAWLPDALADAGVRALEIAGVGGARWSGSGGGEVLLNGGGEAASGELVRPWIPPPRGADVVGEARARAARAAWSLGLAAAPALAIDAAGVANPFPSPRAALARVRIAGAPPALRAGHGPLIPTQSMNDGELLCRVELDGLAACALSAHPAAVPSARWEVSPTAMDNGRLRAELDDQGRLARLMGDGAHAAWRAPALALIGTRGDLGSGRASVRERGPVRATLAIARDAGDIEISTLAHEPILGVRVLPREESLALTLPLDATVALAGDGISVRPWQAGQPTLLRWAFLGDGRGEGVAITCEHAVSAVRDALGVRLLVRGPLSVRLHPAARLFAPGPWWDPAADHAPHLALASADAPRPPRWRLWCPPGVVAGWCGVESGAIELALHELLGGRARASIHLGQGQGAQLAVSARPLAGAARALERADGAINLGPHANVMVRLAPRA